MKAYNIKVKGDVQGVFYRHHTKSEAENLNISGWCQNEIDGSVQIFAQGEEENLEKFIDWTKGGSPMSSVDSIDIEESTIQDGLKGFKIK